MDTEEKKEWVDVAELKDDVEKVVELGKRTSEKCM